MQGLSALAGTTGQGQAGPMSRAPRRWAPPCAGPPALLMPAPHLLLQAGVDAAAIDSYRQLWRLVAPEEQADAVSF